MQQGQKEYLGDGVYIEFDGYGVWLSTQRGDNLERIYLEPIMIARMRTLLGLN
mgnify:CR=1 FL=1|tara:strand:+ start:10671 stop:10829 length:159 start_codon:yes stop_codon:yes gene_type:complete